tara:strand:- start:110 stop:997 length:888 start_codon:yes stop_codon:yes gene_type:complete
MALPGYLEDTGKDLAKQMTGAYSVPIDTTKFTGSQFVAGQDPLQTQAMGLATAGVGSYAPYLQGAQAAMGQAGTAVGGLGALTGPGGGTGAGSISSFQSPYQQQVMDETLRQYDLSRGAGQQSIQDAAVGSGNFGGGREGAMLGQYNADTLANRAGIRAGMLQQGFGQASQARQQAFGNQQQMANMYSGLGQQQMGLSNFQRAGMGQDIGALGQLGSINQAQKQAELTANQQMHQTAAYEPYGRLNQYASGITGLAGGMAGPQYAQQGQADPWGSALSTALGVGGLFAKMPWNKA